ncbi:hypothetical protein C8F01DRAFT_1242867 [Mycena amicta]|nr:hypothetical protein C8F01DRAFT_1242867 [Mycena amicta]
MAMPYPLYRPPSDPNNPNSYPPNGPNPSSGPFNPPPSFSSASPAPSYGHDSYTGKPHDLDDPRRQHMARTPSPTPSEAKALAAGLLDWKALLNWRYWIRKEWWKYYILGAVVLVLTTLISVYHHQIVKWLTPVTQFLHGYKYGWIVPIAVLFVISFPPLFGHEIVAILCGIVWGLWIGFAIVCAGTFLGEVGNFYAFKYCCRARGEKMERTQLPYACLARCVRTGGFKIALIARFSAIPGHFTTAVFATCGMNIFVFSIAAILSLPKQFITVYLGVILEQSDEGTASTKSKIISDSVLAGTFLVTILAMWYIFHQMALVKPDVIYARRKARQGKLERAGVPVDIYANSALNDSDSSVGAGYNPRASLSDIPLTAKGSASGAQPGSGSAAHPRYDWEQSQKQKQYEEYLAQRDRDQSRYQPQQHQTWDNAGRAVGYTPGPAPQILYAPQPQQPMTPGRSPIQPGAYIAQYGAAATTPKRTETGEAVGWDAAGSGGVQMRERGQGPAQRQYTTSPPQQQQQQQQRSQPPQPLDPATPTQTQYASYPATTATRPQAPLSPFADPPRSPFDDPVPVPGHGGKAQHSIEPTGMSYHTAYGSEDSNDSTVVPGGYR